MPIRKPVVIHIGAPTQSAIETALRALPIKDPDRCGVIPYSSSIPMMARELLLMRRPNKLKPMRKKALADLDKTIAAADRLADTIEHQFQSQQERLSNPRIPYTAFFEVPAVVEAAKLITALRHFVATAKGARDRHFEAPVRGRTRKDEAFQIGLRLYQEYERLADSKPKRTVRNGRSGGLFQTLIHQVFQALGIKASAEATTVRVMEEMKKREKI